MGRSLLRMCGGEVASFPSLLRFAFLFSCLLPGELLVSAFASTWAAAALISRCISLTDRQEDRATHSQRSLARRGARGGGRDQNVRDQPWRW